MHKVVLLVMGSAWILIPTGTPDDIITWGIIKWLGPQNYVILLGIVLLLLWHYKITPKKIKGQLKRLFK